MNPTTISVDVAKSVFEVAVSERPGHVVRRPVSLHTVHPCLSSTLARIIHEI